MNWQPDAAEDGRAHVLGRLVRLDGSLREIQDALRQYPWESNSYRVFLTRAHLVSVLERFVTHALTAQQVEDWANALESREDVGFHEDSEAGLKEALHELANPELHEPLTQDRARRWLGRLSSGH
jgi:hypothetical protein